MNVVLYGDDYKYWALTERGREALTRTPGELQIGPSQLHWDGATLTIDINEITAPLPRRVRGTIKVHVDGINEQPFLLDRNGRHCWWPRAPRARIEVAMQQPGLTWRGRAYHDANAGEEPLEQAFRTWNWSRTDLPDRTLISYDVMCRDGTATRLRLSSAGQGTCLTESASELTEIALPRTLWGVERHTWVAADEQVRVLRTLEDAPFYSRSLLQRSRANDSMRAIHESLDLDRFRRPWVQCMLGFRTPRALV